MKELAIARVNNVNLLVCQDPEQLVPIRPICDALGIDAKAQRDRINRDQILASVEVMITSTGSDGKEYQMMALPLKFVFGWLFTIDASRVSDEAKQSVIQYKLECYNALYQYFAGAQTFLKEKQAILDIKQQRYFELNTNFKEARRNLAEAKKDLQDTFAIDYETWLSNSRQLIIPFPASDQPIELEDGEEPSNE